MSGSCSGVDSISQGKGVIKGKAWPRDQQEPADWTVELHDANPNTEGSATLYGYVTGNFNNVPGTEIYFDNVRITPNQGANKKSAGKQGTAEPVAPEQRRPEIFDASPGERAASRGGTLRRPLFPLLARLRR